MGRERCSAASTTSQRMAAGPRFTTPEDLNLLFLSFFPGFRLSPFLSRELLLSRSDPRSRLSQCHPTHIPPSSYAKASLHAMIPRPASIRSLSRSRATSRTDHRPSAGEAQGKRTVTGGYGGGTVSLAPLLLRYRFAARNSRVPGDISRSALAEFKCFAGDLIFKGCRV